MFGIEIFFLVPVQKAGQMVEAGLPLPCCFRSIFPLPMSLSCVQEFTLPCFTLLSYGPASVESRPAESPCSRTDHRTRVQAFASSQVNRYKVPATPECGPQFLPNGFSIELSVWVPGITLLLPGGGAPFLFFPWPHFENSPLVS